ncbi:hypothetical protein VTJ49DRAFT_3008 [Mycothermus thermophilus]|uniref:Polysaccharide lyase n=1 Tax=Humicola insolens TaxID=85995 RepID=A0ABR3V8P7_HUMIN
MTVSALLVTLAALAFTNAGVIFQNEGTIEGWSATQVEHKGYLRQVDNVYFDKPPALAMGQVFDPNYPGRYHSELRYNAGYGLGDTRYYGFAFQLHPEWNFSPPISYNLAQFISPFPKCDSYMPTTMVWLRGSKLFTRTKFGSVCDQKLDTFSLDVEVTAGEWHTIIIGASWQANTTGFLQLWFDGKPVLDKQDIPTTVAETEQFQFRVGLYANGWYDDKSQRPLDGTYEVFYDKIAIATTKDEADPGKQC